MNKKTKTALRQLKALANHGRDMRLAADDWKNDYETLVSTILSARTRDEKTIPISHELFKKYPSVKSLARAKLTDVKKIIKPINFYKTKSKNIINCAKALLQEHGSKIPPDFEQLLKLPGVGRKTANVFLAVVGKDAIGVDTHVSYISQKIGWTKNTKPEKIEQDLKKLFPKKDWTSLNYILVRFGRTHTSRKQKDKIIGEIKKIK